VYAPVPVYVALRVFIRKTGSLLVRAHEVITLGGAGLGLLRIL